MSKIADRKNSSQSQSTDKKKPKSNEKQIKSLTITREIVIKTQEPDIPQITIMKVQKLMKNGFEAGIATLQRIFHQVELKNLYSGLCKILNKNRSSKLHLLNVNKLLNVLRSRQKRLIAQSWNKLVKIKLQKNSKLNTIRLISKISLVLISKVNRNAFEAIKSYIKQKSSKNAAEITESNIKKVEEEFERKLSSLKTQQFSQKFMTLCKKLTKMDEKVFEGSLQSQLEPGVVKQIERFKQSRKGQTSPLNNQTVLIVMNNNLLTSKRIKKELEQNQSLEKYPQQELSRRLIMYQKITEEFEKADDQIRQSFEKYKRVDELQLVKIVEKQLKIWNKNKQNPLYESRLFISAIIVKIIKDGQKPLDQFIQILGQLYQSCDDMNRLQQFRKSLNPNEKSSALLAQIINKFVEKIQVGMSPIIQRQFSQNEQIIMEEIKYIVSEVRVFISKFSNPTQKGKLKKIFSIKKAKAPEQLKQIYSVVNQLISFVLNSTGSTGRDNGQGTKRIEIVLRVLNMFKDCLRQDNYQKWENFLNSQVNKEEYKSLLDVLDNINDILNDKIKNETDAKLKQIENLRKAEEKIKSENNTYKSKITQLEKTVKSLEMQRSKSNQNKKEKTSAQLEKKYHQLVEKNKNLQNERQKQRKLSQQKLQKSQKAIEELQKKLQLKEEQIGKIQKQAKGLREKSNEKQKKDEQIKRINMLAEKKFKQLQKAVQKLKQELEQKNKMLNQNEQKLKKYESTVKKYETELESLLNKNIEVDQNDYNSLIQTNEQLNKKIIEMKMKIDRVVAELENKDNELQNIRNTLVNQQTKQASLQKSRAQYEALIRKIKVLDNTVQNLKHELEIKKKQLQEQRRGKQTQSKKPKIPPGKADKKTGSSVDLIKQLNKQLQKLKRNEVTLQQINKQLQKAHNKGQDVQNLISNVEIENKEYRRTLNEKQKIIYDLQAYITKLQSQVNTLKNNLITLQNQSSTKQEKIRKLQTSLKQRQAIANKNQQNKRDYISKLQALIKQNQQIINHLNSEIVLLKNREVEAPSFNTTQTENYDNLINQLKQANQRFTELELIVLNNEKSYTLQRQQFRRQIQKLLTNGQKWQLEKIKLTLELNNLQNQNQILKKQLAQSNIEELKYKWIDEIKSSWELQRQRWIQDYNNWSVERETLYAEFKSSELQRQRLNNQASQWIFQRQKFISQRSILEEQVRKLKENGNNNWVQEKQRLLLEINIKMEGQKNRWLEQSINYRQKYKRQIIGWQNQRQKWLTQSKQSENKIKSLQYELKQSIERENNLNIQCTTLSQQINSLNVTIQELQYQISISTTTTTSQAVINNIILLLTNIGDNFVRINPKPNHVNDKNGEQIRQDLIRIKEKYWNQESQIFIHFEDYMKKYIQNDIQRYRFELKVKIQELTALRDRLQEYISSEVQTSKTHLNYQYKFESVEKSTASKTIYETPAKSHQKITLISGQVREKARNAERLFESEYIKKY